MLAFVGGPTLKGQMCLVKFGWLGIPGWWEMMMKGSAVTCEFLGGMCVCVCVCVYVCVCVCNAPHLRHTCCCVPPKYTILKLGQMATLGCVYGFVKHSECSFTRERTQAKSTEVSRSPEKGQCVVLGLCVTHLSMQNKRKGPDKVPLQILYRLTMSLGLDSTCPKHLRVFLNPNPNP
jgi:hypothetical protein